MIEVGVAPNASATISRRANRTPHGQTCALLLAQSHSLTSLS
jgi:hypothetical protein